MQISKENTCVGVSVACNFIETRPQQECYPAKFAKFWRPPIWRTPAKDCFYTLKTTVLNQAFFVKTAWMGLITFLKLDLITYFTENILQNNFINRQSPKKPTNCLSVFGHFVGLAPKGLSTLHYDLFLSSNDTIWSILFKGLNALQVISTK